MEAPISETPAVEVSDYLLTEQEAQELLDEEVVPTPNAGHSDGASGVADREPASNNGEEEDDAPSCERDTPLRMLSIEYPRNMGRYRQTCPEVYEEYWQAWLD